MYTYSAENAQIYSQINILGTTYEISFNEVSRLLGNLQGKTVLDFGTGTGRSARFLQMLGAKKVVGVDRDKNMIAQAQAEPHEHIVFSLMTEKTIPLPSEMIDIALSAHALVETRTLENIRRAVSEVARVLRPESLFLLISTNPFSIGYDFKSYTYLLPKAALQSGDLVQCVIKGDSPFIIEDTYWTEEDYHKCLTAAGFLKVQTTFPMATGEDWLDENKIAPDMVMVYKKPGRLTDVAPT